jgi:hypothetical protein
VKSAALVMMAGLLIGRLLGGRVKSVGVKMDRGGGRRGDGSGVFCEI